MATATTRRKLSNEYIPGVCNIGPAERAERRRMAIIATGVTLILFIFLSLPHVNQWWRLFLFIPASIAATGYLQDALHFCAGFGMRGMYNVINNAGMTQEVKNDENRQKDKRKAQQIVLYSVLIGAVVAVIAVLV